MELPEELRQLCELASKETDTEKLFALVAEINRLLQEYEKKNFHIAARVSVTRALS